MEGTSGLSYITALQINMNICLFYSYFYTYFFYYEEFYFILFCFYFTKFHINLLYIDRMNGMDNAQKVNEREICFMNNANSSYSHNLIINTTRWNSRILSSSIMTMIASLSIIRL